MNEIMNNFLSNPGFFYYYFSGMKTTYQPEEKLAGGNCTFS